MISTITSSRSCFAGASRFTAPKTKISEPEKFAVIDTRFWLRAATTFSEMASLSASCARAGTSRAAAAAASATSGPRAVRRSAVMPGLDAME